MQDNSALGRALAMVRDLRARCPWDRAQTRESLRPYLVEEVLELDHALGEGERDAIRDELSDLLLHLAFQLVIAEERGEFSPDDVAAGSSGRCAGATPISSTWATPEPWERIKRKERRGRTLAGSPRRCHRCSRRTGCRSARPRSASTGPTPRGRRRRCARSWRRSRPSSGTRPARPPPGRRPTRIRPRAAPSDALVEEIGDLLFAVVNLARKAGRTAGAGARRGQPEIPAIGSRLSSAWRRRAASSCTGRGWRCWTGCGTR